MFRSYARRLHRWTTLLFALPLAVIIASGTILSFEPLAQQAKPEVPLTGERLMSHLRKHDPEGRATGLTIRTYEQSLTIAGVGPDGEIEIDLATGEAMADDGGFAWSEAFRTARRLHETLLLDLGWVVAASTWAMLVLAALGLVMGWPRFRNSLGGWHAGAAWIVLPLVIASPLTGLAILYGVSFAPPQTGGRGERVPIASAIELLAQSRDPAGLTSLRTRGGRLIARVIEDGALNAYVIRASGVEAQPRNWPRAIHEGNWSAWIAPGLNIIVSIVFMGLLGTGLIIWARRSLRPRRSRARESVALPAAE